MPGPDLREMTLADRYRLDELVGFGGSGNVYAARDLRLQREVAVKVLHPEYAREEEPRRRIRQEALLGARITHPNLTPILDLGEELDARGELMPFIVMPLLRGRMLRDALNEGHVPWPVAVEWTRQLLSGLAALHARSVVHRDVKLDNCMLVYEGGRELLKILDLGLAKVTSDALISQCPRMRSVSKLLRELNEKLRHHGVSRDRMIGHSHFMRPGLDDETLRLIWRGSISPLIEELFHGQDDVIDSFEYDTLVPSRSSENA